MDIKQKALFLIRKYETNDPFDIALALGIRILYEELGSINGYYNMQLRMKQIHINHNLPSEQQCVTCAHELGHAVLHPKANTPFLRTNTFFSIDKMEIEANTFAAELLIPDSLILENPEFTRQQLARLAGYDEKIMEFKKYVNRG